MILEIILAIALFINGDYIVSTNLKLHHHSDEDYKNIFCLKKISQLLNIVTGVRN